MNLQKESLNEILIENNCTHQKHISKKGKKMKSIFYLTFILFHSDAEVMYLGNALERLLLKQHVTIQKKKLWKAPNLELGIPKGKYF